MINQIPTATVIFRDGHEEDATSIFPASKQRFIVCTESGAYKYDMDELFRIRKYHPELMVVYKSVCGNDEFDYNDCWIVDDSVENIVVNWGGQDE